ncbi:hypothetical protein HOP50_05g40680 [Chloropicon primus]|uniref:Chlorophyllase n=1 Tax=Chloropicon primus TaxID=1764295 RepID=A0A5B8MMM5_9CHLO|nr:hypothetical protein A3770_05p40590 [Chloropicon primus]UPR00752.1 hypothetical protein HOP50_05g40680 [Chloropicon primus]|eukprot:QDZ21541.1 hypothetical protein A3770_05p40590 [Chloropicon primus]
MRKATTNVLALALAIALAAASVSSALGARFVPRDEHIDIGRRRALLVTDGNGSTTDFVETDFSSPHNFLMLSPTREGAYPAVVFAHGLCGPGKTYHEFLHGIAREGYVVVANLEQQDCSESLFTVFSSSPFPKLEAAANGGVMLGNLRQEVDFLLGNSSFDGENLALVGHSMGGGAVIDLAAELASSHPGLVKAVAAIAPWNGIGAKGAPRPSRVAHEIKAPLLLICSNMDQLVPCSGEIGSYTGASKNPMAKGLFNTLFKGTDDTWFGGVEAIKEDAMRGESNVTYVDLPDGGHFALAGISKEQLEGIGEEWGQPKMLVDMMLASGEINLGNPEDTGEEVREDVIDFLKQHL